MSRVLNKMTRTAQTWNGALSHSTTGLGKFSDLLDYFFKAGTYVNRPQETVNGDMVKIFNDDQATALKVMFGLRLITRKTKVGDEEMEEVQTGYGRRDEFYKAVVWLHNNQPKLLYDNLALIPVFGCWKDFVQAPLVDVLNRESVYELFSENLDDQLLRKYLPQIRSGKKVRSDRDRKRSEWAKGFCAHMGISGREYRQLKAVGTSHIWQKQMARGQWDDIHFNGIPGKAMLLHTSRKGKDKQTVFERHGMVEKLKEWVLKQKSVKFTGYPYELTQAAAKSPSMIQRIVYDRQFETLIEPLKNHKLGNVWACLDTSGSMASAVAPGISAYDICVSMGLVFSSLNIGHFKDVIVAFDETSKTHKLSGSFCDRFNQIKSMTTAWGSTNFQSVIDLLCRIRQSDKSIPLDDYPETLLVISDMQFNSVGSSQTNYEAARKKLEKVGLKGVRIIWWCVNGQTTDFPSTMDEPGVYMIGGFDPNNLKALMGLTVTKAGKKDFNAAEKQEETPLNGMMNFLAQPIFDLLKT